MDIKDDESGSRPGAGGFSLVELAIVLVVIAVLLSAGIMAWRSVVETRRIAKSASVLYQVRDCLIRRVAFSERYPTYTSNLQCGVNDSVTLGGTPMDVDVCLCEQGVQDAWGNRIRYIEGIGGLQGRSLVEDAAKGITSKTSPDADSDAIDHRGTTLGDIAFILVGENENGLSGTVGYPAFTGGVQVDTLPSAAPDFQTQEDDVYVVVTSQELLSKIR